MSAHGSDDGPEGLDGVDRHDGQQDGHDKHDGLNRRDGLGRHDELGARRRASWGRRDDDERAAERERDERAGGRGLDEYEETPSHAGNGTVNHGPEEQGPHPKGQDLQGRAPDDLGTGAPGTDAPGTDDAGTGGPGTDDAGTDDAGTGGPRPKGVDVGMGVDVGADEFGSDGFGSDELVLRNLLYHAVSEIEPRDGTLEHLRRAVPARRARKRQAVVGMAAAALFIGTAVPALVHVSSSNGSDVNPSIVGSGSHTQGTAGEFKGQTGGDGSSGGSSGGAKDSDRKDDKDTRDKGKGGGNGGSTGGAEPPPPTTAAATLCTAAQLGGGASVGSPDSSGAVYGTFRVSNISGTSCTVTGGGGVSATPQGAADGSKITVANHVAGDAATALPDPSLSLAQLVLAPGAAYEVQFAWVPSEPCPATGGTTDGTIGGPDPSPDPTPTEGETGTTTEGSNSATTQLLTEDGGVVDGSVLVSHTAEGGAATFTTSVSNACAGVVYRTGLLAGV
jgi:hypothetical protein